MNQPHEVFDLDRFCDPMTRRLATPFAIGEWTIATDGAIAVIVPRRSDISERSDAPDIIGLFQRSPSLRWLSVPHVDFPPQGRLLDLGCSVELPWGVFAQKYIRLIWGLDDVVVAPGPTKFSAMRFRFVEGEGLVMPMTQAYARNTVVALADAA